MDNYVNSVKLGLLSMLASMLLLTFSVFGTTAAKMRVVVTYKQQAVKSNVSYNIIISLVVGIKFICRGTLVTALNG